MSSLFSNPRSRHDAADSSDADSRRRHRHRSHRRNTAGARRARRDGCRRIARFAFEYAVKNGRKKITVVHKANVLKVLTGIFLEAAQEIGREYEGRVEVNDRIVDACAMQLVLNPWQFDMLLCTNLFGDILSDLLAVLVGGLGLAPAAHL